MEAWKDTGYTGSSVQVIVPAENFIDGRMSWAAERRKQEWVNRHTTFSFGLLNGWRLSFRFTNLGVFHMSSGFRMKAGIMVAGL